MCVLSFLQQQPRVSEKVTEYLSYIQSVKDLNSVSIIRKHKKVFQFGRHNKNQLFAFKESINTLS